MASNRVARVLVLAGLATGALAGSAQAQLRIVNWNVTNYNTTTFGGRDPDFQTAIYGVVPAGLPLAGKSMSPDIIVGEEFISLAATQHFRNILNSAPGSPGDWAMATFIDGNDTDDAFFYRTSKVQLVGTTIIALGQTGNCNQPRNTMRYDVRPVGYASAGATIGIYATHMKAQGSDAACPAGENAAGRRLIEATNIRTNAQGTATYGAALPAGYAFMMCGDTNIQNSAAPEYQQLVASQANNAGRFFDPINSPGAWNNSATYRFVHTQEPATQMDDRHDQILVSGSLIDGAGLDYIGDSTQSYNTLANSLNTWNVPQHSYRCWGNDGTTYNAVLKVAGNTMVGPAIAQALINTVASNGHLPVLADFRVPATAIASTSINFGQVPQNSTAQQSISVSNAGNTALWTVAGIDTLSYTMAASTGFTAPGGSFTRAPGSPAAFHTVSMNTATTGIKSGSITIATNDPDHPTLVVNLSGEVVAANLAPVANAGPDQTLVDTDNNGVEQVTLDGSASTDDHGVTDYRWNEGASVLAQGPSSTASVSLSVGVHTLTLTVSDSSLLTGADQVVVTVDPYHCPSDLDDGSGSGTPDGGTDINDLLFFLARYEAADLPADLDDGSGSGTPDGGVDINDLLFFLSHYETGC